MKVKRQIVYFVVSAFIFFFITEYIMDYVFKDETPFWKLITISTISATVLIYPLLKRSPNFKASDYLKYQNEKISYSKELDASFFEKLVLALSAKGYKIKTKQVVSNQLKFHSKFGWNTFGERYQLFFLNDEVKIRSKPKFLIDIVDQGQTKKRILEIRTIIIDQFKNPTAD